MFPILRVISLLSLCVVSLTLRDMCGSQRTTFRNNFLLFTRMMKWELAQADRLAYKQIGILWIPLKPQPASALPSAGIKDIYNKSLLSLILYSHLHTIMQSQRKVFTLQIKIHECSTIKGSVLLDRSKIRSQDWINIEELWLYRFFSGSTRDWTQGHVYARQILYAAQLFYILIMHWKPVFPIWDKLVEKSVLNWHKDIYRPTWRSYIL